MLAHLNGYDEMDEMGFIFKKRDDRKKPAKVAKIALVAARKAFLTAVDLNVLKLAEKLNEGIKKNPARIRQFWFAQGGKPDKLWAAVAKGMKRKGAQRRAGMSGVPALPAALASAAPILIAVIKIFKELKVNDPDDGGNAKPFIDKMKDALNLDPGTDKTSYTGPPFDVGKTAGTPGESGTGSGGETRETAGVTKNNTLLYAGAGVAALAAIYLITKK